MVTVAMEINSTPVSQPALSGHKSSFVIVTLVVTILIPSNIVI